MDNLLLHRIHFGFTITYHYLFPQITMGLALLIVILKTLALRTDNQNYNQAARFWARIFGLSFVMGVVTGIPMEFQFGTNWAHFSKLTGGVIAQPLVMEGVFSFFLESAFLGLFLFGEKRLSPRGHWWAAFMVFLGSWLSGFFIIAANAWMQHPVAYTRLPDGTFQVTSFWAVLMNPWGLIQYAHTMCGAVVTGSFLLAGIGAYYLLEGKFLEQARIFVRLGVIVGTIASVAMIFPTGDFHGKMVAKHQPVTMAAMEGLFKTERGAPMVIIGQPDEEHQRIDNPIMVSGALSFLLYGTTAGEVKGLNEYPRDQWPTNLPLLYYSYHVMAGLGTIFVAVMLISSFLLWRKKLFQRRWMLWALMLTTPFPFIANTAGWWTAELGRQPWLVYGLLRTAEGHSRHISAGNSLFSLIGFMGMYALLSILFLFLVHREIAHGPAGDNEKRVGKLTAAGD